MAESFLTLMAEYREEDQHRISVWYDALQNAGFIGNQTPGLRHHISMATFPLSREEEAICITRMAAARFAPRTVAIRHIGIMPGGKTLFAAPDMTPELTDLQHACGENVLNGYLWLPHTTLLIDAPETIAAAIPTLMNCFSPISARLDRLRLCAFWPKRDICEAELTGAE